MTEVSIAIALAAGFLSFISPCVLALLPVYLAFLGNAAVADETGTVAATRAAVLPQALLFVSGFSVVFIVLGTSIGLLGGPLFRIPEARQAVGVLVILLGLLTTGLFGPVLDRLQVGRRHARREPWRSAGSWRSGGRPASVRCSARSSRWAPRVARRPPCSCS
jgi:cytochrome c biogenesis protein CcdA